MKKINTLFVLKMNGSRFADDPKKKANLLFIINSRKKTRVDTEI